MRPFAELEVHRGLGEELCLEQRCVALRDAVDDPDAVRRPVDVREGAGVGDDGQQAAVVAQVGADGAEHRVQGGPVGRVVEQVDGGGQVEGAHPGQCGRVGDEVVDAGGGPGRGVVGAGQADHLLGDVHADGAPGSAAGEQPGVVAVSAGQVEGVEPPDPAEGVERPEQGVGVGRREGRRALRLHEALADGVVLEPHALPSGAGWDGCVSCPGARRAGARAAGPSPGRGRRSGQCVRCPSRSGDTGGSGSAGAVAQQGDAEGQRGQVERQLEGLRSERGGEQRGLGCDQADDPGRPGRRGARAGAGPRRDAAPGGPGAC